MCVLDGSGSCLPEAQCQRWIGWISLQSKGGWAQSWEEKVPEWCRMGGGGGLLGQTFPHSPPLSLQGQVTILSLLIQNKGDDRAGITIPMISL